MTFSVRLTLANPVRRQKPKQKNLLTSSFVRCARGESRKRYFAMRNEFYIAQKTFLGMVVG